MTVYALITLLGLSGTNVAEPSASPMIEAIPRQAEHHGSRITQLFDADSPCTVDYRILEHSQQTTSGQIDFRRNGLRHWSLSPYGLSLRFITPVDEESQSTRLVLRGFDTAPEQALAVITALNQLSQHCSTRLSHGEGRENPL